MDTAIISIRGYFDATYFSNKVAMALNYAHSPACRHIDEKRDNKLIIDDCQLLVAMAEIPNHDRGDLLRFLNLRGAGEERTTDFLRGQLGIVPIPMKLSNKPDRGMVKTDFSYENRLYEEPDINHIELSCFVYEVLSKAVELNGYPRIVHPPEIYSSLADKVYSYGGARPSVEVDNLFANCGLDTVQKFIERAKDKGIILPHVDHGNTHVFPDIAGKLRTDAYAGTGKTYYDRVLKAAEPVAV